MAEYFCLVRIQNSNQEELNTSSISVISREDIEPLARSHDAVRDGHDIARIVDALQVPLAGHGNALHLRRGFYAKLRRNLTGKVVAERTQVTRREGKRRTQGCGLRQRGHRNKVPLQRTSRHWVDVHINVGVVGVPDARLAQLATVFSSEKLIPAAVSFVDIAGIVKGASEGAGLGNKFLANIREADAICQVVRVFSDGDVVHVDGRVDPISDIETINTELALADLQTLEKAIPRLEKEVRLQKEKIVELEEAKKAQELLGAGKLISASNLDQEALRPLQLLTAKPFLYVFNVDAAELGDAELKKKLQAMIAPSEAIFLDAKTEAELAELDEADALELLQSIGMEEPGLATLARVGFETLGLQTYLTAGPKEARAWTIHKGDTAPIAAGVIHTDFQKGFIKAEIVSFTDLISAGTMAEARSRGKVRMEGKEYVMADGDVVEFRFNV